MKLAKRNASRLTSTYVGASALVAGLSGVASYALTRNKNQAIVSTVAGALIGLAIVGASRR